MKNTDIKILQEEKRLFGSKEGRNSPFSIGQADEVCVSIGTVEPEIALNVAGIAYIDVFASSVTCC